MRVPRPGVSDSIEHRKVSLRTVTAACETSVESLELDA